MPIILASAVFEGFETRRFRLNEMLSNTCLVCMSDLWNRMHAAMTMSIDQFRKMPGAILLAIAALAILALGGCQHASPSTTAETPTTWRVLERVGDVRATRHGGAATDRLRPGASITGAHQVTTGMGAVLILASDGMQLTAGENTSFSLGETSTAGGLFLDRGWLRVRLARAADRKTPIKTDHFDVNASSATLTLRTSPQGDDLAVDEGSATVATQDGRHHATLVAGAAAKIDPSSNHDLLIKRASGKAFSKVTPLEATQRQDDHIEDGPAPTQDRKPTSSKAEPDRDSKPMAASIGAESQIVRPASRLRTVSDPIVVDAVEVGLSPTSQSVRHAATSNQSATSTTWEHSEVADQRLDPFAPSSMPDPFAEARELEGMERPATIVDPLQIQFDRLTEGLLDGI